MLNSSSGNDSVVSNVPSSTFQSTAFIDDIPLSLSVSAFNGVSMSPERRGESTRTEYAQAMESAYAKLQANATKGGTLDQLEDEFARFRTGYANRYKAYLHSSSRCISSFITGPANFPVRRAQKRNDIAHRRLNEMLDFYERGLKAAIRNLRPDLRPIMSGDTNALERLQAELESLETRQAHMKAANAAIRTNKEAGHDAQIAALINLGMTEDNARKLVIIPAHMACYGQGYQGFTMTNNNANIRRIKGRIEHLSKAKATPDKVIERKGLRVEDCPADNRIRLFFDGKPDEDVRSRLKSNGFRWAPSIGAWQAYRNHNSLSVAQSFNEVTA